MPWRAAEDQVEWWNFLRNLPFVSGSFLQSPAWALYQQTLGREVRSLVWYQGSTMVGVALAVRERLPAGFSYWSISKGPLFAQGVTPDQQAQALAELTALLAKSTGLFLRLEPQVVPAASIRTIDDEPRATTVVDVRRPWPLVLSAMHPKTRYNINLAQRHGLTFRWAEPAEFPRFWELLKLTATRDGFRTHSKSHYQALLEQFSGQPFTGDLAVRLAFVEHQGELLAASLIVVSLGVATYLHGASGRHHREFMAPYLLHGRAVELLQAAGVSHYDFWGVQPADGSLSQWAGFTRFKLGFGGDRYESPGTFDVPFNLFAYRTYGWARSARRLIGRTSV